MAVPSAPDGGGMTPSAPAPDLLRSTWPWGLGQPAVCCHAPGIRQSLERSRPPPTQLWVSLQGGRPAQSAEKSGSPFLFTLEMSAHLFLTVLPPCRCRSRSSVRTVTWGKQGTVCWKHTAPARGAQRRKGQGRAGIRAGPGVSLMTQLPVALSPSGVEFSGQNGSGPA